MLIVLNDQVELYITVYFLIIRFEQSVSPDVYDGLKECIPNKNMLILFCITDNLTCVLKCERLFS